MHGGHEAQPRAAGEPLPHLGAADEHENDHQGGEGAEGEGEGEPAGPAEVEQGGIADEGDQRDEGKDEEPGQAFDDHRGHGGVPLAVDGGEAAKVFLDVIQFEYGHRGHCPGS